MTKNKLNIPRVKFLQDKNWQTNYICFLARQIADRVYQKHGFYVIACPINHPQAVYFPDLKYSRNFWQLIKNAPHRSVCRLFPAKARKEIEVLLPSVNQLSISKHRLSELQKAVKNLLRILVNLGFFTKQIKRVESITVLLTLFGTVGSFHYKVKASGKFDLYLTYRIDNKNCLLAKTIILSLLLLQDRKYEKEKWEDKQIIADFLLSSTRLAKFFPDLNSQLPVKKTMSLKLIKDSKQYVDRLGFGPTRRLKLKNEQLYLGHKKVNRILSQQEKKVLKLLVVKNGAIATHDEIAEVLWGEKAEKKYSLWAMTKLIQKLRGKLARLNSEHIIYTTYSKGYSI